MDIRTKLVFTLVAVALGSMLALSLSMHRQADEALTESRLALLGALAESREDGLEQVFAGWIDRVRLVASRTQLRLSLREYNQAPSAQAGGRIQRILDDAVEAVEVIEALTVFDLQGTPVAMAGRELLQADQGEGLNVTPVAEGIHYLGVSPTGAGLLRVGFVAELELDGEPIGELQVRMNAQPLLDVAEDRSGMEDTESGETVIITLDENAIPRALHRMRPEGSESWDPVESLAPTDPISRALAGEEGFLEGEVRDKDGNSVWAVSRSVPEAGLWLVVKMNEDEARAPLEAFRSRSIRLGLSLGAFAVLFGTILGFRFSKPIKELAAVADRIREGALSARAVEEGEDEVSMLARTFNDMADEMEQQLSLLREFQRYFDLSRDMLCIAGPDGFFKRVNPAFERTLGWTTEELMSRSFLEFVHPDDLKKTEDEITRLGQGLPTISFENRYEVPSGGYRHLMWTAHPDEESGLIYAIARDITALEQGRAKTAEKMRSLRKRLEEAESKLRARP